MNLKKILSGSSKIEKPIEEKQPVEASATAPAKQEIVRPTNEPKTNNQPQPKVEQPTKPVKELSCVCNHPIGAHDDCGPCTILECECPGFLSDAPEPDESDSEMDAIIAAAISDDPESDAVASDQPSMDLSELPDDHCHHMCENPDCRKWWSHGDKGNCIYPDLINQGTCQECNSGKTFQINFDERFEVKDGKPRLTPSALVVVKNKVAERVKDMSVAQLTNHILFNQMLIQELHEANLHVAKIRRIKEEELAADIPESERAAFIRALEKGTVDGERKTRKPRKTKTKADKLSKDEPSKADEKKARKSTLVRQMRAEGMAKEVAEAIANIMIQTGQSRAAAEAWFNE